MHLTRPCAPLALPGDVAALLTRFGLTLDGLLTDSNPKLQKGAALARAAILHHLPARALAAAVTPATAHPVAARAHLPALAALAAREGLTARALAHNGCPWATRGCAAGCLNWAGHGGLSASVAAARGRRTLAMLSDPIAYGRAILWAIGWQWRRAQAEGLPLAVRLRGTDEGPLIGWHRLAVPVTGPEAQAIGRRFGLPIAPGDGVAHTLAAALAPAMAEGLTLYDYSKGPLSGPLGLIAQRAAGWDLTASMAADRPTATADAAAALAAGFRLAVPVTLRKGSPLPVALTVAAPGRPPLTVAAIDGDATDHRWADPHGVAVILRTKVSRGAGPEAARFSLAPSADPQSLPDGTATLIW